jgi:hypothetical protein
MREWAHGRKEASVQHDFVRERITVLTEWFKVCWVLIFAVGSGSLGILLGPFALRRHAWASTGTLVMLALHALLWHTHRKMHRLQEELQQSGERE